MLGAIGNRLGADRETIGDIQYASIDDETIGENREFGSSGRAVIVAKRQRSRYRSAAIDDKLCMSFLIRRNRSAPTNLQILRKFHNLPILAPNHRSCTDYHAGECTHRRIRRGQIRCTVVLFGIRTDYCGILAETIIIATELQSPLAGLMEASSQSQNGAIQGQSRILRNGNGRAENLVVRIENNIAVGLAFAACKFKGAELDENILSRTCRRRLKLVCN